MYMLIIRDLRQFAKTLYSSCMNIEIEQIMEFKQGFMIYIM